VKKHRGPGRPARTTAWLKPPAFSPVAGRWLGWIGLWLTALGGAAYGLSRLEPYARPAGSPPPVRLVWRSLPPWLLNTDGQPTPEIGLLEWWAGLRPETDVYAPELAQRIAENLARSPWIAQVRRVSKQRDGVILVDAEIRTPLALVVPPAMRGAQPQREAYLVDEGGVRLPMNAPLDALDAFAADARKAWFTIIGVRAPAPAEGQPWPGADLAAGLRLVKFLNAARERGDLPFRSSLRAIDVSNFDGQAERYDGKLRIRTLHPRTYIDWGLPPGDEYNIEAAPSAKLHMLRAFFDEYGYLPDVGVIILRWPDPAGRVTIRPLDAPAAEGAPAPTRPPTERTRPRGRG
jgi:hypothetical protein